jgi:hypothetical protein
MSIAKRIRQSKVRVDVLRPTYSQDAIGVDTQTFQPVLENVRTFMASASGIERQIYGKEGTVTVKKFFFRAPLELNEGYRLQRILTDTSIEQYDIVFVRDPLARSHHVEVTGVLRA